MRWPVALLPVLMMLSTPALACPVCGGGGANAQAYIDTMIFLSALPLLLLGGVAFFFWWKTMRVTVDEEPSGRLPQARPQP